MLRKTTMRKPFQLGVWLLDVESDGRELLLMLVDHGADPDVIFMREGETGNED
jgi:hypothetical protein